MYGNPKIVENFHGRDIDFHGKKKTLPLVRSRREKTPGIFVLVKTQWVKWHKSIHQHGLKKTDLTP